MTPQTKEYEVSPRAKPDLGGKFAGLIPRYLPNGIMVVRMTAEQAKWYIDQGVLKPRR